MGTKSRLCENICCLWHDQITYHLNKQQEIKDEGKIKNWKSKTVGKSE